MSTESHDPSSVRHLCPACGTAVELAPTSTRQQRAYTRCPGCGRDLVLYGGQLRIIGEPQP